MSSPGPLAGKKILVTRARHQAGQLSMELAALGAEVIEIPAIEILPPDSYRPLDTALRNLHRYQWLIVTSANTVRVMRERLVELNVSSEKFSHLKIAAMGSATAHALHEAGLEPTLTPNEYVAESLIAAIGDQAGDTRVLIARAAIARDVVPDALTQKGAHVEVVDAYRTVIPQSSLVSIAELFLQNGQPPDAATFTSSSTVTNFFSLLKAACISEVPQNMRAISIGPITSQTLRDHGWQPATEANPHDLQGLVAAALCALRSAP